MKLELLSRRPAGKARSTPLLFVHGAFGGAWVWDRGFLQAFADAGWEAHAVSLRGHGRSGGRDCVALWRMADYVDDVQSVAASLSAPPVLIGHSMGGLVVQSCLHRFGAPAAVLMASGPPHGLLGTWLNMGFYHPQLLMQVGLMQMMGPAATDIAVVKRALFSDSVADETVLELLPRFGMESPLAMLDMLGLDLPPSRSTLDLPVLVIGAENDAFIYPGALTETAKTYRTKAEVMAGMAHALMLDDGWPVVAERLIDWLDETVVEKSRSARPHLSVVPSAAAAARS